MRRIVAVLSALGPAVAFACSSFSSSDPAPSADAAPLPAPPAEDAGQPFCSTVDAQFCWSFDEGAQPLVGPKLSATKLPPSLTDQAKSPPSAMQATLSGAGTAAVELDVGAELVEVRCELDLFLTALASNPNERVALLSFDFDGSLGFFPLIKAAKQDDATARAALGFLGLGDVDLGNVPIGRWVHAFLEAVALGNGSFRARAGIHPNPEGTLATVFDGGAAALPRFTKVRFGLSTIASVSWTVRYDDLFCSWH